MSFARMSLVTTPGNLHDLFFCIDSSECVKFSWTCHLFEVQGFIISADDMYPFFCNIQPQTSILKHAVIPINTDFLYIS